MKYQKAKTLMRQYEAVTDELAKATEDGAKAIQYYADLTARDEKLSARAGEITELMKSLEPELRDIIQERSDSWIKFEAARDASVTAASKVTKLIAMAKGLEKDLPAARAKIQEVMESEAKRLAAKEAAVRVTVAKVTEEMIAKGIPEDKAREFASRLTSHHLK